jgi:predicted DNA-binding transcriptional regulator AlpA
VLLTTSRYAYPLMPSSTLEPMHHLVGIREIAEMLGVSPQRVDQLSNTARFPKPEAELKSGRIWKRAAVEKWAKATGRTIVEDGR